jgi:hypothetical protein
MLLKKYSDFGGGKKKSDSEFLSYNLMLNSGKKLNILTFVLSEKQFLNGKKTKFGKCNNVRYSYYHNTVN